MTKKDLSVTNKFTQTLIDIAKKNKNFIVLDADLSDDLGLKKFSHKYPNRFIQNGIAEQDMISMAGGIARMGVIPIVNSFASFLTARGNEQIYNNATEGSKIIYLSLYAGAIPAGAGKSHQSLRDISLLSNIPNFRIFHPYNPNETHEVLKHCLKRSEKNNCAIRLSIGPMPKFAPPMSTNYKFQYGIGNEILEGRDALIFTYGQTMVSEAYRTATLLKEKNISLEVINMPCLNYFDKSWISEKIKNFNYIFFLDDHNYNGGVSDLMISFLTENNLANNKNLKKFGFKDFPACGSYDEVLKFHKLDYKNLAKQILDKINS
jgi:transketolase